MNSTGVIVVPPNMAPPCTVAQWTGIHRLRNYRPPTCWDLVTRDGRPGYQHCEHSTRYGCDLRVVGLSTYRLDAWRRAPSRESL